MDLPASKSKSKLHIETGTLVILCTALGTEQFRNQQRYVKCLRNIKNELTLLKCGYAVGLRFSVVLVLVLLKNV
jgi:hypothetical protein